ncbi:MAG: hypothetical protein H7A23_26805 [Leptospiraceae bacterium]|nr:hypothetical protein [Leptospiraceae bacterium]
MNNRKIIALVFIIIAIGIIVIASMKYYPLIKNDLFFSKNTNNKTIQKLTVNPDYVIQENLLSLKSVATVEYFRQRMLYHKQVHPENPERWCIKELQKDFHGEKGKILSEMLIVYNSYMETIRKLEKNPDFDEYEKLEKTQEIRKIYFGEVITTLLFPIGDYDTIEKFFSYADRYLKKNYSKDSESKRIHLEKARKEIYGADYSKLSHMEPLSRVYDLEIKILDREISNLSPEEKKEKLQGIKRKLKQL